ncbi:hypothetical protein [Mesorhizobium xinjiangense]|uniref:hypothetical protein n=1 Tax=Mesorhizobium xinjiangense TaxID=2678685 RepID=UPI0012EE605D|nr:hypothetical protein [Mesorhizobium xinjiangense]
MNDNKRFEEAARFGGNDWPEQEQVPAAARPTRLRIIDALLICLLIAALAVGLVMGWPA